MSASMVVAAVMLVGKLTAYFLTHSAALLADAAEAVVHGGATTFAAFSLWYASVPADSRHPYGHGRIAYFSAGFEGAFVLAAAVAVVWTGINGLIKGVHLQHVGPGLAIASALALINFVLGVSLIRIGRRHNVLILVANGRHALADMWTTLAAIVGVALVWMTGVWWLDPLAALIIGAWIMFNGISLARRSFAGLMDAVDPELARLLTDGLQEHTDAGRIAGFHQLRCRRLNDEIWVDVHVLVPCEQTVTEAHVRATELEESIRGLFPDERVHVLSHVEPADHESAHPDGHAGISDPFA